MSAETLDLVLPDWGHLDTVRHSPLPFALWTMGDQCLLHHWLDHAVNQGATRVRVFAADRPAAVRSALEESFLWPLAIEFVTLSGTAVPPDGAVKADWLPGEKSPPPPADGWELMDRAAGIERAWLERLAGEPDCNLLNIGFQCRIHPDATLVPPYFIGDQVLIGPGCEVGPNAVIGPGSVISQANRVVDSHVAAWSFLGPVTGLERCWLDGGVLYHLRHRERIDRIEPHLLGTLKRSGIKVPLRDRLRALLLYRRLPGTPRGAATFETFDGMVLPGDPAAGLSNRRAWLPLVWQGKLPLYGVLPRTAAQLEKLTPDWQNAIRHAPAGVFSYADTQGCHTPDDPEEALHAVYQTSLPPEAVESSLAAFIRSLRTGNIHSPTPV
jgi:hypothetical protein